MATTQIHQNFKCIQSNTKYIDMCNTSKSCATEFLFWNYLRTILIKNFIENGNLHGAPYKNRTQLFRWIFVACCFKLQLATDLIFAITNWEMKCTKALEKLSTTTACGNLLSCATVACYTYLICSKMLYGVHPTFIVSFLAYLLQVDPPIC